MGVFLYSNKQIDSKKVEEVFKTRGHKEIKEVTGGGCPRTPA